MALLVAVTLALVVCMLLLLTRALLGPTVYDRMLAVNTFGTVTVLMIAVAGYLMGRPFFLDIAMSYALINFIGTVAVLKFFEAGGLGARSDSIVAGQDANTEKKA